MAYGDFKNLPKRIVFDKVLRDKAFNIAKNPEYDEYHGGFHSMVHIFFNEKSAGNGANIEITSRQQLAEKLHKPIIRKIQKQKVHSSFIDNT